MPGDLLGGRVGRYQYPVYIWEVRAGGSTWGAGGTVPVPSLHLRGKCRGIYVGGGWDGTSTQSTFERYVPGDLLGGRVGRYQYPVYIWEVRAGGSTWGRVGRYQYPVYIWEVRAGGCTWGAGGTVPVPSLYLRGTCRGMYVGGGWDGTSTQSTFERYVPGDLRGGRMGQYQYPVYIWEVGAGGSTWGAGGTVPVPSLHLRGRCRGMYVGGGWDGTSTQSTFERYVPGDLCGGRVGRYQYPVYIWEVRAVRSMLGAGGTVPVPSLLLRGTCRGIYVGGGWDGTSTQSTFERYVPGDLRGGGLDGTSTQSTFERYVPGDLRWGRWDGTSTQSIFERYVPGDLRGRAGGTVPVPSLHLRGTCRGIYVGGRVGRYQCPVYIWEVRAGGSTWGRVGRYQYLVYIWEVRAGGSTWGAGGTVPVPSLHLRGTCRGIYVGGGWDGTSTQSTFERYVPGDLRGGRVGRYQYPVYIWEVRAGGSTWGRVGRYQYPVYIWEVRAGGSTWGGGWDGTSTQSTFERYWAAILLGVFVFASWNKPFFFIGYSSSTSW